MDIVYTSVVLQLWSPGAHSALQGLQYRGYSALQGLQSRSEYSTSSANTDHHCHRNRCSKAAAAREKGAVKEVMRLKARKEKVSPSYKAGAREITQIAQAMHDAMVLQNSQKNTVLREHMSCGWGAWRPQQGRLFPAGSQDWARDLPGRAEGSGLRRGRTG